MFIKLSLALVVMALVAVAAEDDHLIKVIESDVLEGKQVLKDLRGKKPLSAEEVAWQIARTKDKPRVLVDHHSLYELFQLNIFDLDQCKPYNFVKFNWTRKPSITDHPNLKKYCDEVMRLRKDRCKKSLDIVFSHAIGKNVELQKYVSELRKFEDKCKDVGYNMAGTMCLEDFLISHYTGDVDLLRVRCENFVSQVNDAIRIFDLDKEHPFGDLARSQPWLTTAARDCAQMVEVAEKWRLFDQNSEKQTNRSP
jgi:hypothetical protein